MDNFIESEGYKYMWDGEQYATEAEANKIAVAYGSDGFQTKQVTLDGKYLVYSRRVVTEIVVEGQP